MFYFSTVEGSGDVCQLKSPLLPAQRKVLMSQQMLEITVSGNLWTSCMEPFWISEETHCHKDLDDLFLKNLDTNWKKFFLD